MPIFYLTTTAVLKIHERLLAAMPGPAGVRERGLIESAVARPRATFGGIPLHPTFVGKAAALLESLCMNHAFVDGNKRVAWLATLLFLETNGWTIRASEDDAVELMLGVAAGKLRVEHIRAWLERRIRPYGRRR